MKLIKLITEEIKETSGSITFSLDDKYIFYSKFDENHRPRTIYRHKLGRSVSEDELFLKKKVRHLLLVSELVQMRNIIL